MFAFAKDRTPATDRQTNARTKWQKYADAWYAFELSNGNVDALNHSLTVPEPYPQWCPQKSSVWDVSQRSLLRGDRLAEIKFPTPITHGSFQLSGSTPAMSGLVDANRPSYLLSVPIRLSMNTSQKGRIPGGTDELLTADFQEAMQELASYPRLRCLIREQSA